MANKANQLPEDRDKLPELTKLEFDHPICRYESTAPFQNNKGQQFLVRVSGVDKAAVEQCALDLLAHFEVLLDDPPQPLEQESLVQEAEIEQPSLALEAEPQDKTTAHRSTQNLEIALELVKVEGIKRPRFLNFSFFKSIGETGLGDNYPFSDATEARVTIIAHRGTVSADLFKKSPGFVKVDSATIVAPKQATLKHKVNARTDFLLTVKGADDQNAYQVTGDVKVT
jgi:hypothetical protein